MRISSTHLTPVEPDPADFAKAFVNEYKETKTSQVSSSTEGLFDCDNKPCNPEQELVQYCIVSKEDNSGRNFYIYNGDTLNFKQAMQISNILGSATAKDFVHIDLSGESTKVSASVLISALLNCAADVEISCPMINSVYTAAILCYAKKIKLSPYMFMGLSYGTTISGGGIEDTKSAIVFNDSEFDTYLNILKNKNLITDGDIETLHNQRQVYKWGSELCNLLNVNINGENPIE